LNLCILRGNPEVKDGIWFLNNAVLRKRVCVTF
jgi:hypothetical protein